MPIVIFLFAVPAMVVGFAWLITFDRIVKLEREEFPDAWELDGRPAPVLPLSSISYEYPTTFKSYLSTNRCGLRWSVRTPRWASESDAARPLFRKLRTLWVTGVLLWVLMVVALIITDAR